MKINTIFLPFSQQSGEARRDWPGKFSMPNPKLNLSDRFWLWNYQNPPSRRPSGGRWSQSGIFWFLVFRHVSVWWKKGERKKSKNSPLTLKFSREPPGRWILIISKPKPIKKLQLRVWHWKLARPVPAGLTRQLWKWKKNTANFHLENGGILSSKLHGKIAWNRPVSIIFFKVFLRQRQVLETSYQSHGGSSLGERRGILSSYRKTLIPDVCVWEVMPSVHVVKMCTLLR